MRIGKRGGLIAVGFLVLALCRFLWGNGVLG
jgi:hypothetical protein